MSGDPLSPGYTSGEDIVIRVGKARLSFRHSDFTARVVSAALQLGLTTSEDPTPDERADLLALATIGMIPSPASPLGHDLAAQLPWLVSDGRDVVHWLRRLVVRSAWIDQQVRDGRLDPSFEPQRGFAHRHPATGAPAAVPTGAPDWSGQLARARST